MNKRKNQTFLFCNSLLLISLAVSDPCSGMISNSENFSSIYVTVSETPELTQKEKEEYSKRNIRRVIESLESEVVRVEKKFESFTEEDWAESDKRIKELTTEFDSLRKEMTESEVDEFNKLKGRYLAL